MRIDAHQHFWKYDPARDTWITGSMSILKRNFLPEDLNSERCANRIDGTIAVQADPSENETLFLLDLAERYPNIGGVVGWVDLTSSRVNERLHFFSQFEKLCGFRHIVQSEPDNRFLLRDDFMNGISHLKGFGFTYDILVYPKQLSAAIELVSKFPEQRFIIDHLAKPEIRTRNSASWSANIKEIAKAPNVSCKLSGMVTEADWNHWKPQDFKPYLDIVFEAFGAERLMFGSDWPVCLLAASYQQVLKIIEEYLKGQSASVKERIFGGNAVRFYRLKTAQNGLAA
jgi:L-fuconolactonase